MKYKNCVLIILLAIQLLWTTTGCVTTNYEPQEGVWFCEELNIQLSYESGAETYVTRNNQRIICVSETDRGSKWIGFVCWQECGPDYNVGDQIWGAEIISLNESVLVVYQEDTEREYTFQRIE